MQFEYEKSKFSFVRWLVGWFFFICFRFQLKMYWQFYFTISDFTLFFARLFFGCLLVFSLYYIFFSSLSIGSVVFIQFTYMISLDWIHPGWTAFCSCWPSPWSDLWFSCWKLKWYWPYYWTKSMWLSPCPLSHKHTHLIPRDCYMAQWWMCLYVCVWMRRWWWLLILLFFFVTCLLLLSLLLLLLLLLPFLLLNWFTGDRMYKCVCVCLCVCQCTVREQGGRERARYGQSTAAKMKKINKICRALFLTLFARGCRLSVVVVVCVCVCKILSIGLPEWRWERTHFEREKFRRDNKKSELRSIE